PNITVTIKGTKNATQTNAEGVFRIRVAPGATLVFSAINYATFEAAAGDDLKVQLTSASATLTDVVVVGYGTARKKDVTGSVATITSKDFQSGQISTPEQLIAGKVPGVQISTNGGAPGAGSTIRIRGGASLNASNDPLIIIDGMPLSNDGISGAPNPLSLINPNDIETFTVLKDASAAAIYGSRASNGVILITTKKGKKGAPQINFSTNLSSGTVANTVSVLTADQVRSLVAANAPASVGLLGTANTNWQDQIYQNAITTDNNLSISGAHKGLPYRVSLGYLNQQGVLRTGNLQRTSLGINLNPSLFKNHLKIDVSLKGSYNKSFFANEGAIGSAVTFDPTQSVRNDKSNRFGGYWEWLDPASRTGLKALAPRNPMGLLMQNDNRSEVKRSIGNVVFDYKLHFLPDVRAVLNVGYDVSESNGTIIINDSAASAYKRFQDANGVLHGGVNNQYKQTKYNNYMNFYLNYAKDFKAI
ncbi:MAG: TonB-dependent receptor plug domain-containing protein, partial [Chitinophagaceae bacterium]